MKSGFDEKCSDPQTNYHTVGTPVQWFKFYITTVSMRYIKLFLKITENFPVLKKSTF